MQGIKLQIILKTGILLSKWMTPPMEKLECSRYQVTFGTHNYYIFSLEISSAFILNEEQFIPHTLSWKALSQNKFQMILWHLHFDDHLKMLEIYQTCMGMCGLTSVSIQLNFCLKCLHVLHVVLVLLGQTITSCCWKDHETEMF